MKQAVSVSVWVNVMSLTELDVKKERSVVLAMPVILSILKSRLLASQ